MKLSKYNYDLEVELSENTLSYSGIKFQRDYIFHTFTLGTPCNVKFRTRKVKGFITKITKKMVHIDIPCLETSKTCSIADFVDVNFTLECLVRLEFNGQGIYRAENHPPEMNAVFSRHKKESMNQDRFNQPTPNLSWGWDFVMNDDFKNHKFAFRNYDKLFEWFGVTDLSILMKHGAKIVYVQELRDYTDARYCPEQIAYNTRTKITFVPKIPKIHHDIYDRPNGWNKGFWE